MDSVLEKKIKEKLEEKSIKFMKLDRMNSKFKDFMEYEEYGNYKDSVNIFMSFDLNTCILTVKMLHIIYGKTMVYDYEVESSLDFLSDEQYMKLIASKVFDNVLLLDAFFNKVNKR